MKSSMRMKSRNSQRGAVLLDGLIAILVFSVGILGMIALQGTAVKLTTDSKYRTDAAMLADQAIAQMWGVSNNSTLLANFATGGTCTAPANCYSTWAAGVQAQLPGVTTANKPTITFDANGATVIVFWQAPNDGTTVHQYETISPIAL